MSNDVQTPVIFDRRQVRRAFDRAAAHYDEHAVLQQEVASRLLGRLDWLKINPKLVFDVGAGTGKPTAELLRRYPRAMVMAMDISSAMLSHVRRKGRWLRRPKVVCGDAQQLPVNDQSVDLVFSSLALQWCDQPAAVFAEVKRVLKPDGVFIFSTFGPDTLKELRLSWAQVDEHVHVHPFLDMHDIGDLLVQSGLQEPVMARDEFTLTYDDVRDVMRDVRNIGAGNAMLQRPKGLLGRRRLQQFTEAYEEWRSEGRLPATYEVVYGTVWSGRSHKAEVHTVPVEMIGRRGG